MPIPIVHSIKLNHVKNTIVIFLAVDAADISHGDTKTRRGRIAEAGSVVFVVRSFFFE